MPYVHRKNNHVHKEKKLLSSLTAASFPLHASPQRLFIRSSISSTCFSVGRSSGGRILSSFFRCSWISCLLIFSLAIESITSPLFRPHRGESPGRQPVSGETEKTHGRFFPYTCAITFRYPGTLGEPGFRSLDGQSRPAPIPSDKCTSISFQLVESWGDVV